MILIQATVSEWKILLLRVFMQISDLMANVKQTYVKQRLILYVYLEIVILLIDVEDL